MSEALSNYGGSSVVAARIESVDDKEVNKAMFGIFEKLIAPVEHIEQLNNEINRLSEMKESGLDKASLSDAIRCHPIRKILILTVIGSILFVFFNGLIGGLGGMDFLAYILIAVIFGVPFVLLCGLLYFIIRKDFGKEKERAKAAGEEIAKIDGYKCELENCVKEIAEPMKLVPPSYRSSRCLKMMVDAYANSKVDNLKEAVNHCEKAINNQNQQLILGAMASALSQISYNQLQTQQQLRSIERDIWWSNIMF